jgi:hypothetical protein
MFVGKVAHLYKMYKMRHVTPYPENELRTRHGKELNKSSNNPQE